MNQEKFTKRWNCMFWGTKTHLAWAVAYKYITAATVQGHDPSTVGHSGTLPVLFTGAKYSCWVLNLSLCSVFFPCTTQGPQSLCYYALGWIGACLCPHLVPRRHCFYSVLQGLTHDMPVMVHLWKVYIQYISLKSTECIYKASLLFSCLYCTFITPQALRLYEYRWPLWHFAVSHARHTCCILTACTRLKKSNIHAYSYNLLVEGY